MMEIFILATSQTIISAKPISFLNEIRQTAPLNFSTEQTAPLNFSTPTNNIF
jgi:hypothetical protein